MDKQQIIKYQSEFDKIGHFINDDKDNEQVEIWFARELQILLGYKTRRTSTCRRYQKAGTQSGK